jgi:hypothetical protein
MDRQYPVSTTRVSGWPQHQSRQDRAMIHPLTRVVLTSAHMVKTIRMDLGADLHSLSKPENSVS